MERQLVVAGILTTFFLCGVSVQAQTKLPPETRNAALRYWLAFADLQDPPSDKTTQELLEKTAAGETPWDEAKLGGILDQNEQAILEMRRATKLPECDWGLEYSRGPQASIAYVARARVLARLNTLYGMRAMAKGQTQEAVETWLDGVRFSRHLAQGGTLIFKLVAKMSLLSNFEALTGAAQAGQIDEMQRREIAAVVHALPDDAFDWSEAMAFEESAIEIAVQQVRQAKSPAAYYQEMTGRPAPPNFSIPSPKDLAAIRSLFAETEAALRLPPEQARPRLQEIVGRSTELNPLLREMFPSPVKVNDARAEIEAFRSNLLLALAKS